MDYLAVGNAIAARFTGLTAPTYSWQDDEGTTVTATDDDLRVVTATLPNQLSVSPALYVMPPEDREFSWGMSSRMRIKQFYTVRLVRDQTQDMARRMAALSAWRPLLITRIQGQIQLGLSYVDEGAYLRSSRIGEWPYAETTYDVVELVIEVNISEVVTGAA